MEYSRSFAIAEAVVLFGLVGWLYYINNASRSRRDSDDQESGQSRPKSGQEENGGS